MLQEGVYDPADPAAYVMRSGILTMGRLEAESNPLVGCVPSLTVFPNVPGANGAVDIGETARGDVIASPSVVPRSFYRRAGALFTAGSSVDVLGGPPLANSRLMVDSAGARMVGYMASNYAALAVGENSVVIAKPADIACFGSPQFVTPAVCTFAQNKFRFVLPSTADGRIYYCGIS